MIVDVYYASLCSSTVLATVTYKSVIFARCTCEFCGNWETLEDNFCCQEKEKVAAKVASFNTEHGGEIRCITAHPGFRSNCLDIWTLETAYLTYAKKDRRNGNEPINE